MQSAKITSNPTADFRRSDLSGHPIYHLSGGIVENKITFTIERSDYQIDRAAELIIWLLTKNTPGSLRPAVLHTKLEPETGQLQIIAEYPPDVDALPLLLQEREK
jgi:hypothetical protein